MATIQRKSSIDITNDHSLITQLNTLYSNYRILTILLFLIIYTDADDHNNTNANTINNKNANINNSDNDI